MPPKPAVRLTSNATPLLLVTSDDAPAYLLTRVTHSESEAAQADRQERELDAIQTHRGQKKPVLYTPKTK